ncbi:ATP-dependent Clp protease ATP-binding subunit ClpC [Alphaproteobacteria bacterium]|nr:ATP-dependent Clp protease ATP-binding subunit ClpC [Alphaproteobacteria bacterium]
MNNGFEFSKRLTDNARDALRHGEILAINSGGSQIGTEHLLLGILGQEKSVGAQVLAAQGVDFDKARVALAITTAQPNKTFHPIDLSEAVKLTIRMSIELAQEFHQDYCGTEHFLFSLLSQDNSRAVKLMGDMGIDIKLILDELEGHLNGQNGEMVAETAGATREQRGGRGSYLNKFAVNLTSLALKNQLDPVIGRDKEVTRLVTILSRRTKNNPVLIGEPGVGKTAVVEGLAQRVSAEDVPEHLVGKQIYQLDLAGMLAGTKYRGEFEERIKKVLDEVRADRNVVIFIDELHLLMGAGAADGAMDAANMLKPALARGDFRLIGSTTLDEYRRHIEKDAALTRRLQTIIVDEPNIGDTIKIINGLKDNYEQYHNVRLPEPVIAEAVRLADRYITERFMPDKAIDVIDEAAALTRVRSSSKPSDELKAYRRELTTLNEKMDDAAGREDYEAAALLKMRTSRLQEKIAELDKVATDGGRVTLKLDDVAQAVSVITGVPVAQLKRTEMARLANLEKYLRKSIIGQDEAVASVAQAIRRSRSGISAGQRPIGSFVFLGPTGVGKTELARVVAREVFGSEKSLIKIDMSEYSEKHNASRLVGAPAGYVGYDDANQLTDKVRRQPYSVVLFDEIEKAHPDVFNMLLQLLEDGRLTDGKGREVDFSNTVVILTSNLGSEAMMNDGTLGFKPDSDRATHENNVAVATKALDRIMRPELINRFDDIVVFRGLDREAVGRIFDNMIDDLNQRLAHKGLAATVDPPAKRQLINRGFDNKFGARPLRRVIQDEVEHAIAEGILKNRHKKGDIIRVGHKNGKIALSRHVEWTE